TAPFKFRGHELAEQGKEKQRNLRVQKRDHETIARRMSHCISNLPSLLGIEPCAGPCRTPGLDRQIDQIKRAKDADDIAKCRNRLEKYAKAGHGYDGIKSDTQ